MHNTKQDIHLAGSSIHLSKSYSNLTSSIVANYSILSRKFSINQKKSSKNFRIPTPLNLHLTLYLRGRNRYLRSTGRSYHADFLLGSLRLNPRACEVLTTKKLAISNYDFEITCLLGIRTRGNTCFFSDLFAICLRKLDLLELRVRVKYGDRRECLPKIGIGATDFTINTKRV